MDYIAKGMPVWSGTEKTPNRFTHDQGFKKWHAHWPFACVESDAWRRLKAAIDANAIERAELEMEFASGKGVIRWWTKSGAADSAETTDLMDAIRLGIDRSMGIDKVDEEPEQPSRPSIEPEL